MGRRSMILPTNCRIAGLRRASLIAVFSLLTCPLFGLSAPFTGLDDAEKAALERGEVLFRRLRSVRDLSCGSEDFKYIRSEIGALRPNYLTEVLAILPVDDAIPPLGKLLAAVRNVEGYVGIPYWSKQFQKTFPLLDRLRVISRTVRPAGETIEVEQHMMPFEDFRFEYAYSKIDGGLLFRGTNTSPLVYKGINAVATADMLWHLRAFRDGDKIVFYGVGAVKAFDLFGAFRDRLEISFVGRTEAFFEYLYARLGFEVVPRR
jgi:hypothetical protein